MEQLQQLQDGGGKPMANFSSDVNHQVQNLKISVSAKNFPRLKLWTMFFFT
jgi:hypothetical protein